MAFNFAKVHDRLNEIGFQNVQVIANPSDDFIQANMMDLYNNPEVTNIKVSSYPIEQEPQQPNQGCTSAHDAAEGLGSTSYEAVANLKEEGNMKFKAREYRPAIELYTKALATATSSTPSEIIRTILSNRSQSYLMLGDARTALYDNELALSDEFTKPSSPNELTLKLHYRGAKIYFHMACFNESQAEFDAFKQLRGTSSLTAEEQKLKCEIKASVSSGVDSKTREKHALIRAVDSRGLMLTVSNRCNFPFPLGSKPSPDDYKPDGECMAFITTAGPRTKDTPISILVHVIAPEFIHSPYGGQFHAWTAAMPESEAIGSIFMGMFKSYADAQPADSAAGFVDACKSSAMYHGDPGNTVILIMTYRGWVLVVLPDTLIKDLIVGTQWPKVPGSKEFTDKTKAKRKHDFEFDGIELLDGWYIDIYLLPKESLQLHLDKLEEYARDNTG